MDGTLAHVCCPKQVVWLWLIQGNGNVQPVCALERSGESEMWGEAGLLFHSAHKLSRTQVQEEAALPMIRLSENSTGLKKPSTLIRKTISTPIIIAVLFTITKIWKQPKGPSVDKSRLKKSVVHGQ